MALFFHPARVGGSIVNPRKLEHRFRMIHAGIPFTFKGMRLMMFQLSSFYCRFRGIALRIC